VCVHVYMHFRTRVWIV